MDSALQAYLTVIEHAPTPWNAHSKWNEPDNLRQAQAVNASKRGNEGLKRFRETCFKIANVAAPFLFAPHTLCRRHHDISAPTQESLQPWPIARQ